MAEHGGHRRDAGALIKAPPHEQKVVGDGGQQLDGELIEQRQLGGVQHLGEGHLKSDSKWTKLVTLFVERKAKSKQCSLVD